MRHPIERHDLFDKPEKDVRVRHANSADCSPAIADNGVFARQAASLPGALGLLFRLHRIARERLQFLHDHMRGHLLHLIVWQEQSLGEGMPLGHTG